MELKARNYFIKRIFIMIFILVFMGWQQYVSCQTILEVQDRLLHNTKFHEFYHGTAGSLKNEGLSRFYELRFIPYKV